MRKTILPLLALVIALAGCSAIEEAAQDAAREQVEQTIAQAETTEPESEAPAPEPEPTTEAPAPEPEPEPEAAHGTYGSDARLDRLYEDCDEGDLDACDTLFWDSPLDSEYEAFAQERMYGDAGDVDIDMGDITGNDDMTAMMFEIYWDSISAREQEDACLAYEILGSDVAYDAFAEGFGADVPNQSAFDAFFRSVC